MRRAKARSRWGGWRGGLLKQGASASARVKGRLQRAPSPRGWFASKGATAIGRRARRRLDMGVVQAPCDKGRLQAALKQGRRAPAAAQCWGAVEGAQSMGRRARRRLKWGPLKKGRQPTAPSSVCAVQGTQSMGRLARRPLKAGGKCKRPGQGALAKSPFAKRVVCQQRRHSHWAPSKAAS